METAGLATAILQLIEKIWPQLAEAIKVASVAAAVHDYDKKTQEAKDADIRADYAEHEVAAMRLHQKNQDANASLDDDAALAKLRQHSHPASGQ